MNSKFKDKYIFKSNNKGKRYFPPQVKTSSGVQYKTFGAGMEFDILNVLTVVVYA